MKTLLRFPTFLDQQHYRISPGISSKLPGIFHYFSNYLKLKFATSRVYFDHKLTFSIIQQSKTFICSLFQQFRGCSNIPITRKEADSLALAAFLGFIPFSRIYIKNQKFQDFYRSTVIFKVFQVEWELRLLEKYVHN